MYLLEDLTSKPMHPHMKTGLLIGGAAAAAALAFLFWPKSAAAAAPATPVAPATKWSQVNSLTPGANYVVFAQVPGGNGAMLDRTTAATALSQAGWTNGGIDFYPGDPSQPTSINGIAITPALLPQGFYIFHGQWTGPATALPAGVTAFVQTA